MDDFEFDFEFYDEEMNRPKGEHLTTGDFLDMIFFGLDAGWVCLTTWPGGKMTNEKGRGPTQEMWFAWPEHRDRIIGYTTQNEDKDMYIVPALFENKTSRRARNIRAQTVFYADADNYSQYRDKIRIPPSITVHSSPNNAHLYWVVTDCTDPRKLAHLGRNVAHAHADDGMDKGGWDAGQLLRVPNTYNSKPGVRRKVVGDLLEGLLYHYDDVLESYPQIEEVFEAEDLGPMPPVSSWPSEIECIDYMQTQPDLLPLYTKTVRAGEGDRSERMYALLSSMRRKNIDPLMMLAAGWYSGSNKYRQGGRPPEEFWTEVNKAYNDPANLPTADEWEIDAAYEETVKDKEDARRAPARRIAALTFLKPEEQAQVPFDTFIDSYVTWARGLTDAVPQYQRAGAITVLSAVFGEYGKAPSRFHLPLTCWFMAMGPSTRSRKTTAMRIMTGVLDSLSDGLYTYVLGDDVTPEGIAAALADRPEGTTSVMYRDEFHGMLTDEKEKKYMSGLQTTLTQLYDGYNRSRIRAGKKEEKQKKVAVNVPIYGTGVFKETAGHLTEEDFTNGHLTRFVYVLGDPGEMTAESEWLDQIKPGHEVDLERLNLLDKIREARDFWDSKVTRGQPVHIKFEQCDCRDMCTYQMCVCEDCPWRRWNAFAYEIRKTASTDYENMQTVLEATADRLAKTVMKVACLLAMSECYENVQMRHLLKAIDMSSEWFQHMVLVAKRVKATEWRKKQDDVSDKVMAKGNRGATKNELYRAFRSQYSPAEFEVVLHALTMSGTVHKHEGVIRRGSASSRVERFFWPDACEQCD